MYFGGTLFNDHASSQIQVYHEVSLGTSDTIRSKQQYELEAGSAGVKILPTVEIMECTS